MNLGFSKGRRTLQLRCLSLGLLTGLVLLIALFAAELSPYDPYAQDLGKALLPPSAEHWLGTDRYGRDMLSRVMLGGRTTVLSTLALVGVTALLGGAIGLGSGFRGGRLDTALMRLSDVFLAFPGMVFAIAVAGLLGGGIGSAAAALVAVAWPKYARLTRSLTLTVKELPYVDAARLSGASALELQYSCILPNIVGPLFVTAALDIGTMMMELAGLSFLGLGAAPPLPEWGSMMSNGRSMLQTAPWVILAPGGAIFITVVLFNLLGDALRDVLDTRQGEMIDDNK